MASTKKTSSKSSEQRANVVEVLNKARSMELHAIYQYMHQHYNLDDEDYGKLAAEMRRIAIDEMRHAEWLAERIKDLDGEPTTTALGAMNRNQPVDAVFPFDADLEDDTLTKYNEYLKVCRDNGDQVSADLFERIILEEKAHWDYFDDTGRHIRQLGDHFLARMAASGPAD